MYLFCVDLDYVVGCILQCVVDQVGQYLFQYFGVGYCYGVFYVDFDLVDVGLVKIGGVFVDVD